MDERRMAPATDATTHCLNSSLLNKIKKVGGIVTFVLIQAESRNPRHAEANEDKRSMSSVVIVYAFLPSDS